MYSGSRHILLLAACYFPCHETDDTWNMLPGCGCLGSQDSVRATWEGLVWISGEEVWLVQDGRI
jgi:hypothetical protein